NIPNKRTELVRGVLIAREPAGHRHGRVAFELGRRLGNHVAEHQLGAAYAAETGFTLARRPDTVRAPDVAFVRRERLPDPEPVGFPELAPDLAVEVLSPGNRPGEVLTKVADWLSARTPRPPPPSRPARASDARTAATRAAARPRVRSSWSR